MEYQIADKILFLLFLFALSGILSCSEAALFSLTPLHLHKMGEDKTPFLQYVKRLLLYPQKLLITLIVGNEAVNIGLSVISASLFIHYFGMDGKWIAILVTTILLLIFGESIPKTFAVVHPIPVSSAVAPFITFVSRIESPVVWLLAKIADAVVRFAPGKRNDRKAAVTEEEFKTLIDAGHLEGALEESQRNLIHSVFELGDKPVSEIMIPRVDMFCLPISKGIEEMEKDIVKARHSIVPVYGTDRDEIIGILHAKDLLDRLLTGNKWVRVYTLLRKPYFVPMEKTAGSLLQELQERRLKVAIVVDEYGGVSGMVTIRDILESLVEDLYAEDIQREDMYQALEDGTLIVPGKMPKEDFNSLMNSSAIPDEFDTLGGFVFHLFGKLPAAGDKVFSGDHEFRIEQMGKARILKIMVVRRKDQHG
jgi:putative hemolysin